jgi:hypothetical protein
MAVRYQLVINAIDPEAQARFWAAALGYVLEPPPAGFATWKDHWLSRGIPEEEAGGEADSIVDPDGHGPRIWFQPVTNEKTITNRLHIDVRASGSRTDPLADRRRRVDAEATRLVGFGATQLAVHSEEGVDHYAVAMTDPEGNEFDVH